MSVTFDPHSAEDDRDTTRLVASPPEDRPTWPSLRPLVLRLHFYAGVFVAPFLFVAAVTGFLYACSYQAEKIVYAHELRVPEGKQKLPLSQQVDAARRAHPEGTVSAVRPSPDAGTTTRVLLAGTPGAEVGNTLAVFVNPYTAQVRGALEQYGTSGALPLRAWIDHLHRDLHLGEPGRLYSEFAASWLWVITGGGLMLWFARRRAARKVRRASGRRRTLSLHGSVGAWAAVGLFFLSATGLTWSTYAGANITELRAALGQETPIISASAASGGEHAEHQHMPGMDMGGEDVSHSDKHDVGLDAAWNAARAEGLSSPLEIVPPGDDSSAYVVQQIQRSWPEKQDAAAVDPTTGQVTDVVRFADYPLLAKLSRWGIDLHTGTLFGIVNQAVLAVLALALAVLVVLGYRMWWQRGRESAFGRPIPRGGWRRVPRYVLALLIALSALLGYVIPLLGIPLAGFLVIDSLLGAMDRRRGDQASSPAA
ncbi:PepSY domain-containing protein [Streptomyces sp. NPDC050315]|uniref:PepSY-associated TM helix domain-containing protein n=1 Tax=Streptomyces sp. NPDC050315 TaxID=3155039 RepID=UPI00343BA721